jgi:diguanylate cyclase (GGDEF)-like protein/PAS domain S-box-containing protein
MTFSHPILLVDDEPDNRDMLARRLALHGYTVEFAESGNQALECLNRQKYDIVLMDIHMPGLNGLETLHCIREHSSSVELPVIMVTASDDREHILEAFRMGANDYVTKPVDLPIVLARIRTHIHLKQSQAALRASEERYALAARGTNDGIWDWDVAQNVFHFSPRWKEMLGFAIEEVGDTVDDWLTRVHPDDLERVRVDLAAHHDGGTPHFENAHRIRHKDGGYRWMLCRGLAVRNEAGTVTRMAGSQSDVTGGTVADPLTGLPNRVLFLDRLKRAIERSKRDPEYQYSVLFLDLDRFKVVNDSLGHLIGDQLLMTVSKRLEQSLRVTDTVARMAEGPTIARMGGDEFTILLDGFHSPENVVAASERILSVISQPFQLGGHEVVVSASIGIAHGAASYELPEDLLRDADTALYCAKNLGKARHSIFDATMRADVVMRLEVETDLRQSLTRNQFDLYYQPITDINTGVVSGFEALLRWNHPTRGFISPANFIPIAEETGLIVPIGWWALRRACQQLATWRASTPAASTLRVAVNLSPKQLRQRDLVEQVRTILRETNLHPSYLTLEVTESSLIEDPTVAGRMLGELRSLGIRISLDDFGTGYSSLSHLYRLPINTLKIDRSFISGMCISIEHRKIVQAVVTLANNLEMDLIAEGVETELQREMLREFGCGFAQGFLFSPATPADEAFAYAIGSQQQGIEDEPAVVQSPVKSGNG